MKPDCTTGEWCPRNELDVDSVCASCWKKRMERIADKIAVMVLNKIRQPSHPKDVF